MKEMNGKKKSLTDFFSGMMGELDGTEEQKMKVPSSDVLGAVFSLEPARMERFSFQELAEAVENFSSFYIENAEKFSILLRAVKRVAEIKAVRTKVRRMW